MYKLVILLVLFSECCQLHCLTINTGKLACGNVKLPHGRVRYRQRGRIIKYQCNAGYILAGERYSLCVRNAWDNPVPTCVRPTCSPVATPLNGLIFPAYKGALLNFYCKPGFEMRGANLTFCDGTRWSANLPSCVETGREPAMSCDFETADLCGWSHDLNHDFDWRRQNLKTPSGHVGTGPSFDHTKGEGKDGYYVYIESSSKLENDTARLISPIYSKMSNGLCFKFFYHMYGHTTGQLKVYIKKEKDPSNTKLLKPLFWLSGNQGDVWNKGIVVAASVDQPFQIIIEGVRGASYVSDIAVDDLELSDGCPDEDMSSTTITIDDYSTTPEVYESCQNRCDMETSMEADNTYPVVCECVEACVENNTCCPDYTVICILGATDDYTESTMFTTAEPEKTTMKYMTNATTNIDITSAVPKITKTAPTKPTSSENTKAVPKITKTTPTKPTTTQTTKVVPKIIKTAPTKPTTTQNTKPLPKITRTAPTKPTPIKKSTTFQLKPVKTTPKIVKSTTKTPPVKPTTNITVKPPAKPKTLPSNNNDVLKPNRIIPPTKKPTVKSTTPYNSEEEPTQESLEIETDYFVTKPVPQNDRQMSLNDAQATDRDNGHSTKLIVGIVGSVLLVMLAVLSVTFAVRRYDLRLCNGFRTYKNSQRSDSQSDVRFLTSDEQLDFRMRTDY